MFNNGFNGFFEFDATLYIILHIICNHAYKQNHTVLSKKSIFQIGLMEMGGFFRVDFEDMLHLVTAEEENVRRHYHFGMYVLYLEKTALVIMISCTIHTIKR